MNNEQNKTIYIVLTHSGSVLSKLIKMYTRAEYSHVSLSLDSNLNQMYSFGRFHAYNPFFAGFVHENTKWGTFKRFKKTKAAIYSLNLTPEQYNAIADEIALMNLNNKKYHFNFIGLFCVMFNKKIVRKNHYYCAEFIKALFEQAKLDIALPNIVKPNDFNNLAKAELEYRGLLNNYQ